MNHSLSNKKILIAISAGIAAYKIQFLIRDFIKSGAEVQVIITPSTEEFVTKATLSTLSKKPVFSTFNDENGTWNNHVELALWADVLLVAPCTANTLAKMSHGICDNLVLATYLSAKCPVFIAPAMDLDMYAHPTTQENLKKIESFGNSIIPVENGELASGLIGKGRLAAIETIFKTISNYFSNLEIKKETLIGTTVLITAGPTYEAIDPVRFIGNHSSGKMGFSLAEEAAKRGAKVILISGPSAELTKNPKIEIHRVTSAKQMYDEVFKHYDQVDIAIASAAVADFTPENVAQEKIKKNDDEFILKLVKNPDILKNMGDRKKHQFLVGFALETENEEENAKGKLIKKNLDMIVLNSLKDKGAGFKENTNKIKIFSKSEERAYPLKSKEEVAIDIFDFVEEKINK